MSKQKSNYLYLTGEDGLYDTTFPTSPKGEKGVPGNFGADGQKGSRGEKGTAGQNGNYGQIVGSFSNADPSTLPLNGTIPVNWDGTEPKAPFDVEIGEALIDTRNQNLWVYTPGSNSTNWTNIGDVGAVKGERGTKGDQGDKGQKGAPGLAGTNGANGAQGSKGDVGPKGDLGTKGEKGINGQPGANGALGPNGVKGQKGIPGTAAAKGEPGTNGLDGAKGSKGDKGAMGARGLKGEKGNEPSPNFFPRMLISFSASGSNISIRSSFNVASITRPGGQPEGVYEISFSQSLGNSNYAVFGEECSRADLSVVVTSRTASSLTISVETDLGVPTDSSDVNLMIYKINN